MMLRHLYFLNPFAAVSTTCDDWILEPPSPPHHADHEPGLADLASLRLKKQNPARSGIAEWISRHVPQFVRKREASASADVSLFDPKTVIGRIAHDHRPAPSDARMATPTIRSNDFR